MKFVRKEGHPHSSSLIFASVYASFLRNPMLVLPDSVTLEEFQSDHFRVISISTRLEKAKMVPTLWKPAVGLIDAPRRSV
jgi:hypothetical protein